MITDRTLANLRTAASLVLLTPGLSVSVEVGGDAVVQARRPPFDPDERIIPVCAFHRCVGRAHGMRRAGSRVEMVGVAGDLEPTVNLQGSGDVNVGPGGIVRRSSDGSWLHLVALSLPSEAVEPVAAVVAEDAGVHMALHADRVLDVTVLVADTPAGDRAAASEAIDALERIAAKTTVDAIVGMLDVGSEWDVTELTTADIAQRIE